MKYTTIKIRNNSVSQVKISETLEEAIRNAHLMFEEQIGYFMDDNESEEFDNDLEIYIEEDHDNHYTFSVNVIED